MAYIMALDRAQGGGVGGGTAGAGAPIVCVCMCTVIYHYYYYHYCYRYCYHYHYHCSTALKGRRRGRGGGGGRRIGARGVWCTGVTFVKGYMSRDPDRLGRGPRRGRQVLTPVSISGYQTTGQSTSRCGWLVLIHFGIG